MATVKRERGPVDVQKVLRQLDRLESQTGWYSSSKYEDGTPAAYVATIQEFGSPQQGIPSRSFQRVTLDKNKDHYSVLTAKGVRGAIAGKISARKMYDAIGLQLAGDMRAVIGAGNFQALADSTIAARARKRGVSIDAVNKDPLRDTNVMVNTLTNQTAERGSV